MQQIIKDQTNGFQIQKHFWGYFYGQLNIKSLQLHEFNSWNSEKLFQNSESIDWVWKKYRYDHMLSSVLKRYKLKRFHQILQI